MNCDDAMVLACARVDGEIVAGDAAALDAHLAACGDCRAAEEAMRLQHADLSRAFAPRRTAAAEVAERVAGSLRAERSRSARWRRAGALLAAMAAGFVLAMLLAPWLMQQQQRDLSVGGPGVTPGGSNEALPPVARLALATGVVEVLPVGETTWRPIATGGRVCASERVRTGPAVRCEFLTPDGSTVRLNSETELGFPAARTLDLAQGQVWSGVAKDAVPFRVSVPEATVTALGTQFDLSCHGSRSTLTVVEGSTRVKVDSAEAVVQSGEALDIVDGRLGQKQSAGDLVMATRWVHEILVMKGRDDAELADRVDDLFAQIGQSKMSFMCEEEIRTLGDHCVLPLTRYLESDRSKGQDEKRRDAARILADAAQPWAVGLLIELLSDRDGEVRYHAARALHRLTARDMGRPAEHWRDESAEAGRAARAAWEQWWAENKERFSKPR